MHTAKDINGGLIRGWRACDAPWQKGSPRPSDQRRTASRCPGLRSNASAREMREGDRLRWARPLRGPRAFQPRACRSPGSPDPAKRAIYSASEAQWSDASALEDEVLTSSGPLRFFRGTSFFSNDLRPNSTKLYQLSLFLYCVILILLCFLWSFIFPLRGRHFTQ
jgi:hypothetical protein